MSNMGSGGWGFMILFSIGCQAGCNNKLSRYDAVNHSAKCKYYKYGNIDIVVRTPEPGIVLELCFYNIRLLHLIYYTNTNYYFIESFTTYKDILTKLTRLERELMILPLLKLTEWKIWIQELISFLSLVALPVCEGGDFSSFRDWNISDTCDPS